MPSNAIPKPLTLFLIEDNAVIRDNLVATLQEMVGVTYLGHAETQQQAQDWMRTHPEGCDLLIVDLFLKAGNGIEVLRQASELHQIGRRIVLTNFATPAARERCLATGAERVFDKSNELEDLIAYCQDLQLQLGNEEPGNE